jgi:hypothetical protein
MSDLAPLKVNKYDGRAVKQLFDDHVIKVIAEEKGYGEDTRLSNVKLVLGLVCSGIALLSHFYPLPFPKNMPLLIVGTVTYWLLAMVIQIIVTFLEGDRILSTDETVTARQPLIVSSTLPRFSDTYTLIITPKYNHGSQQRTLKKETSIAQFIHEDGTFAKERFAQYVRNVLREFETKRNSTRKEE